MRIVFYKAFLKFEPLPDTGYHDQTRVPERGFFVDLFAFTYGVNFDVVALRENLWSFRLGLVLV